MVKQREPMTAQLMLAFDNLTIAIQQVECATAHNISESIARLQEQRRTFRALFNGYFLRNT